MQAFQKMGEGKRERFLRDLGGAYGGLASFEVGFLSDRG